MSRNQTCQTIARAVMPTRPTSQTAGWRAAAARPPSSGTTGIRLMRLMRKPAYASACRSSESVARAAMRQPRAPSEPTSGPARATCASRQASFGSCFIPMTAPTNGMKRTGDVGTPWRRRTNAWPSSWTKMSATNPIANCQPHSHAYAATDTNAEPTVVIPFSLRRAPPNLATSTAAATSGLTSFFSRSRRSLRGWIGS
jgi:hypothetical protein